MRVSNTDVDRFGWRRMIRSWCQTERMGGDYLQRESQYRQQANHTHIHTHNAVEGAVSLGVCERCAVVNVRCDILQTSGVIQRRVVNVGVVVSVVFTLSICSHIHDILYIYIRSMPLN